MLPPCCPCHRNRPVKRRGIRQGMHACTDGLESMRSSLNHDGTHHFGSASETVAFCADAALFEPSVTID